jgi:hypothetical protein
VNIEKRIKEIREVFVSTTIKKIMNGKKCVDSGINKS